MEEILTQQVLNILIGEVEQTIAKSDEAYASAIDHLKTMTFGEGADSENLNSCHQLFPIFFLQVQRLVEASRDLDAHLKKSIEEGDIEGMLRNDILKEMEGLHQVVSLRQEARKLLSELLSVLETMEFQRKRTPAQRQKIEEIVFRLQVLG